LVSQLHWEGVYLVCTPNQKEGDPSDINGMLTVH
jgi:hypothetical protein